MNYSAILTDILYPPRCPGCDGIISTSSRFSYYEGQPVERTFLHKKCRSRFAYNNKDFCVRCGTPVQPGLQHCERCRDGKRSFEEGRSVFLYQDSAKEAMMGIKYKSRNEFCDYFAFAANEFLGDWIRSCRADVIVPVPVHPKKRKERGYNQAEELSKRLSSFCGVPTASDVLLRVQNTKAQKELNPEERRMNLMHAFDIGRKLPEGSAVLLVDDIYTTGATMDTCAWILKSKGGAAKVYCLSMCVAVHI